MLKLIKYHPLFSYSVGDEFEVSDADKKFLLEGGFAVPAGSEKIETAEAKMPGAEKAVKENKKK
jgi:hypothetical protein